MRTLGWTILLPVIALTAFGYATPAAVAEIPGDVDGDGFVGGGDLSTVLTNWGMTGATRSDGDVDPYAGGDGFVGGGDYSQVLTYWGTVPEPATLALLAVGGMTLLIRGMKERRWH